MSTHKKQPQSGGCGTTLLFIAIIGVGMILLIASARGHASG